MGPCISDWTGIWQCWFLWREGGERKGEKCPRSKNENQQQTQPPYDGGSGNRTQATLVKGDRSHHCAIPAPLGTRNIFLFLPCRRESCVEGNFRLDSPATSERIRMACVDQFTKQVCDCHQLTTCSHFFLTRLEHFKTRGVSTLRRSVSGENKILPGIWRFCRESGRYEVINWSENFEAFVSFFLECPPKYSERYTRFSENFFYTRYCSNSVCWGCHPTPPPPTPVQKNNSQVSKWAKTL